MVKVKKSNIRRVVWLVIMVLIIWGGFKWFGGGSYPDIDTQKPTFGSEDSPVKVIEFSDLQCPACKASHPAVELMKNEYGDRISFQYFHYPLRNIHPYAQKAAEAVECANDQGMFFEYIDAAFERSPSLQRSSLIAAAEDLGLNVDDFKTCLNSGAKEKYVNADVQQGNIRNIRGTPTFFVNGKEVSFRGYPSLKLAIDAVLPSE